METDAHQSANCGRMFKKQWECSYRIHKLGLAVNITPCLPARALQFDERGISDGIGHAVVHIIGEDTSGRERGHVTSHGGSNDVGRTTTTQTGRR